MWQCSAAFAAQVFALATCHYAHAYPDSIKVSTALPSENLMRPIESQGTCEAIRASITLLRARACTSLPLLINSL